MREGQQSRPRSGSHSLWLSRAALSFVALAAVMGWGASFVGLHAYGQGQMVGFSYWTAWLVPGTFDGAAFGATLITYRASIYGRSAVRGRMLMWSFTAISSWINWIHQVSPQAQIVAAGLPIAAVAVFDVVLAEMRADFEERHGKRRLRLRPGLLLLRWIVDRTGTGSAFRRQVTDIPVSEIAGLATQSTDERAGSELGGAVEARPDQAALASDQAVAAQEPIASADEEHPAAIPAAASPTAVSPTAAGPTSASPAATRTPAGPTPRTHSATAAHPADYPADQPPMAPAAANQFTAPAANGSAPTEPTAAQSFAAHSPTARPSGSDDHQSEPSPVSSAPEEDTEADDEDARAEPTGTAAQAADAPTVMLPPVPASPLNELSDEDKRTFARRDYRLSLDTGSPLTGADLGRRYGYSERWGRRQIAAVRVEDREGEEAERSDSTGGGADDAVDSDQRSTGDKRHLVALRD